MIAGIAEGGFLLVLVAVVPALSYRTSRRPEILALPRLQLYLSAAISQWLLAALGVVVVWAASLSFAAIGFHAVPALAFFFWTAILTCVSLAALGLVVWLELMGWWSPEPELVRALIPRTREEKIWAVLVIAPTAAVCEEFLYRGFLLAELSQRLHSVALAAVLSSLVFGMAHTYQGLNGIARAALLGFLLAIPVIRLGSVFPSMASHFLIDAVALTLLGPEIMKKAGR